ncbi:MAG: TrkA C-terminal domain-containing protein, partial [Muribaculaceae bacterium]|nr:TrkA C-terminal domain-containing protein [Muribaculaceae bacterium]
VPPSDTRIFPGDVLGIIGTDEQIGHLLPVVEAGPTSEHESAPPSDYVMTNVTLTAESPLIGKTMAEADVARQFASLIVAVNHDGTYAEDIAHLKFSPGDTLYVVGRRTDINRMA